MSQSVSHEGLDSLSLCTQLRWRGTLQAASLRVASAAIVRAPTLDDCALVIDRAREDLEALEETVERHRDLCGEDLGAELQESTASLPVPESWLEVVVAQLVLSVAAQLEARASITYLARTTEQVAAARSALRDLWATSPAAMQQVPELVSRWLGVAASALDDAARAQYLEILRQELEPAPLRVAG